MTWLSALPSIGVSLAVLLLPGAAIGAALRLRGLALAAASAPLSTTAIGVGAVCFDAFGLGWGVPQLAVTAAVLATLAWGLRAVLESARPQLMDEDPSARLSSRNRWALAASLLGASTAISTVVLRTIPSPELLAQAHDTIFHAPAVHHIVTTGHGSSLTLGSLAFVQSSQFYPAVWHDAAALGALVTGAPVPVAINALNLVIAAVVWPVSVLWLTRLAVGVTPLTLASAAVLSAGMPLFPYLPMQFGVIYPFFFAVALLPAILGFLCVLFSSSRRPTTAFRSLLVLLLAAPGVVLTHPSMITTTALLVTPLVLTAAFRLASWVRTALAGIAWLGLLGVLWGFVRPNRLSSSNWEHQGRWSEALEQSLLQSHLSYPANPVLAVLLLAGLVLALSSARTRWLGVAYALVVAAYVIGSWGYGGELRWALTGVWYNDYFRIVSLTPVVAVPLGALAVTAAVSALRRAAEVLTAGRLGQWAGGVAVALLAVLLLSGPGIERSVADGRLKYALTDTSALVTEDEVELMLRLDETVPAGTAVAGDPLTGTGLAGVYGGVRVLQPTNNPAPTADGRYLMLHLDEALTDPRVCRAAETTRVEYVLDFGHSSVNTAQESYRQGFLRLDEKHGFSVVDHEGSARLLRITACTETGGAL